jgi:hypothetical protein
VGFQCDQCKHHHHRGRHSDVGVGPRVSHTHPH